MTEAAADVTSIGARLSGLRGQHGYSIRGLAAKAGVSASLISDIEKGKVEPSITTLSRLALAMGTTIAYFFTAPRHASGRLIRASDRVPFGESDANPTEGGPSALGRTGVRFELGSPVESKVEVVHARYEVGGWFGDEPFTHGGEEWGMVLSGRMKIIVGDEVYFLDPGDSIWFPSTIPHRLENVASTVTEYLWVGVPKDD